MRWNVRISRRAAGGGIALALCIGAGATTLPSLAEEAGRSSVASDAGVVPGGLESPEVDPRLRAFLDTYRPLIDSVSYPDGDVVFHLGRRPIHFQDGRMIAADRLDGGEECDPIFYHYPLTPLTEPPAPPGDDRPRYCSDLLESLWGRTERQVRANGRSTTFLEHRMFVNELIVPALAAVEGRLLALAERDDEVAEWIEELDITYSYVNRGIRGSENRSHHAWGMAVDLVPESYEGRHVYWRWSRALDREGWFRIPIERRWSPPRAVIDVFEQHGFVWGGKWALFDTIHFEYRPEILRYNQLIQ